MRDVWIAVSAQLPTMHDRREVEGAANRLRVPSAGPMCCRHAPAAPAG
jgi:hypothetical protein